jgi:hypothetical protein
LVDDLMSVTIYGQHDGDAIFEEDHSDGLERIPTKVIHVLYRDAIYRGADEVKWLGRPFLVDSIGALRRDLDAGALPELDTCAFTTPAGDCDNPAIHGPWCPQHADED